jgi:hypothetical protein
MWYDPNMYILNVAITDMFILTVLFIYACANRILDIRQHDDILCGLIPFCYGMPVGLTTNHLALFGIQQYRVTVDPL